MATLRSRATDISQYRGATMHTRRLQEGLYTHLDQQERAAFIEVLNTYGVRKDIFELVNSLRKILNTPVKRQLFPLVRGVIRKSDMEAFDLLTRGGKNYGTLPRPFLYRPHAADISVLRKHRSHTLSRYNEISHKRKASSLVSDFSDREEPPVLSGQNVQTIFIETRDKNYDGFGFNIRGGSEYGLGVYVSSVDEGGPAEIQGLQVGDLVLEANDISFQNISHGEAARMIRAASRLELTICRVGRVPGTHTVHEAYKWVDARGRPVSPPPDLVTSGNTNDDADIRSRSSLNLLKGSDERKVNVVVDSGHSLGLTIRGGRDYGLGVYVSGVDPYSVAENAGLKVGDQLLDANGQSMAALSHAEAVRVLTRCRHMVLTVKDVGRVPYAKTTIDRTHWVNKDSSDALQNGGGRGRFWGRKSVSEPDLMNVGFSRGAGSQLMLSAMSTRSQYDIVEDQARVLLNTEEQATLRYYLAEYTREVIRVPGLAFALAELFNTGAKLTLMSEIRPLIQARDLDTFDRLVNRPDIQTGLIKPVMQPRTMDALTINIPTTSITTATTTTTTTRHRVGARDRMQDEGEDVLNGESPKSSLMERAPTRFVK
ncbi:whirlin-like [Littorina saxatilis]|uniref:whirlin-like n=1 Tax=Littorina saxatilis TaxID=31220 RepID=UPI0038B55996